MPPTPQPQPVHTRLLRGRCAQGRSRWLQQRTRRSSALARLTKLRAQTHRRFRVIRSKSSGLCLFETMQVRCRQKRGRHQANTQTWRSRPRRHLCDGPLMMCADIVRCTSMLCVARWDAVRVCRTVVVECGLQCRTLTHMAQSSEAPRMPRRARSVRSTKRGGRCCMSRRCCHTAMPAHVTAQMLPGALHALWCSTGTLGDKKSRTRMCARACARECLCARIAHRS